ncbi:MAG: hypothetical protein IPH07_13160 [Deltaproteobacteria bacterium]|nr:hypothetical protein [Deltaproteobacteria bacterium]MBK8716975.1 hypothetical protein [Deltaproteobacteria bacterium]MBP7292435.1 hypothetical protein [Nannocystaceae bacterium]
MLRRPPLVRARTRPWPLATLVLAWACGDDGGVVQDSGGSSSTGGGEGTSTATTATTTTVSGADSSEGGSTSSTTTTDGSSSGEVGSTGSGSSSSEGGSSSSGADTCGNQAIDTGEDCDGPALGGQDCVTQGQGGGTLACAADCTFDLGACTEGPVCGDGLLGGDETCDGAAVGDATCVSLGHGGGVLGCSDDCAAFDESGCAPPESCANLVDDDLDGAVDCADADCLADEACAPIESVIDCDPVLCTFTTGGGPHGGDLCSCLIPGGRHPTGNDVADASCFGGSPGRDLEWVYDTTGYLAYAVSTCEAHTDDSSIASYDGDPGLGATELACGEDAPNEADYCSEILDSGDAGPAQLTSTPAGDALYLVIDEWNSGSYWDNLHQRTIDLELLPLLDAEVCDNGFDDDGDAAVDCDDDECDVPLCSPTETLIDCDPTFCTLTAGSGPNGGDLCHCVLLGPAHPQLDDFEIGSCFGGQPGRELLWTVDLGSYSAFTVTTCNVNTQDSSIAVFDADPQGAGVELACSEDASGEANYCSEITSSGDGGDPLPTDAPESGELWLVVDEWNPGSYWDGVSPRTIDLELIP